MSTKSNMKIVRKISVARRAVAAALVAAFLIISFYFAPSMYTECLNESKYTALTINNHAKFDHIKIYQILVLIFGSIFMLMSIVTT